MILLGAVSQTLQALADDILRRIYALKEQV